MRTFKMLLKKYDVEIKDVIQKGGIDKSSIYTLANKEKSKPDSSRITGAMLQAVALTVGIDPGTVINDLLYLEQEVGILAEEMQNTLVNVIQTEGKEAAVKFLPGFIFKVVEQEEFKEEFERYYSEFILAYKG
ncbi:hypothetical protein [Listeria seeligeri]|uniref:hypothetical protein n=1 Tax=Listeria seeligeri TaxID=1640 RepID=UPI0016238CE3|nr:hypothetical protein [Listeria seeligeri]MBC1746887.1 hypothetical protein [Listeria seeligeri]MBC2233026.1 hypothetical protein [Listeria seeligeri]MBF2626144.1 hypothetical protein [Listeria seeligeri]MBF2673462.1 hypothetical protein [Listeria seeligeri]